MFGFLSSYIKYLYDKEERVGQIVSGSISVSKQPAANSFSIKHQIEQTKLMGGSSQSPAVEL